MRIARQNIAQPRRGCMALAVAHSPSPCTQGEGRGEGPIATRKSKLGIPKTLTLTLSRSTGRGDKNGSRRERHRRLGFPHRGFTLIELVVAMTMVAIMAASLYASLQIAFRAKASADAALEMPRTAELAMEYLRGDLQNALPPNPTAVNPLASDMVGTDGTDDRGADSDDVVFYSTAQAPEHASANGEIKRVELCVVVPDGRTDHVLVRRVTRNLLSQIEVNADEEVICRGVAGFNLRYYDGADWLDTWDSAQQGDVLPLAVEVTLELTRPGQAGQPDHTFRFVRVFTLPCAKEPA